MPDTNWYDAADLKTAVVKPSSPVPDVMRLQQALDDAGYAISVDGIYGDGTNRVLRAAQRQMGLVADGIAGPKTFAALEGLDVAALLGQDDIERAADALGVSVPAVMAVNEVESRGHGFLDCGLPVILFERHWMRRQLEDAGIDPAPWAAKHPGIVSTRPGGYQGGRQEHDRLAVARAINEPAALQSASWGLFQIMGFHYASLGFDTPEAMERAASHSEGRQLDMFVAFIRADADLHRALEGHDWADFAERYNGPAYAKNQYDARLSRAFARHARALAAA